MSEAQDGVAPTVTSAFLPLELVPEILHPLSSRLGCLASCALVSRIFNQYATPLLYSHLVLRSQRRLELLFRTLATKPRIAQLLKALGE